MFYFNENMSEFCHHRILITFQQSYPANIDQVRQIIDRVINGPPVYYEAFKQSLIDTGQGFIVRDILNKGKAWMHNYELCK